MKKTVKKLRKGELAKLVKKFPDWKLDSKETKFTRVFKFDKPIDALIFIARTTINAEILKHHPDVLFTSKEVKMTVTTHEVKGLTKSDILLLTHIEQISNKTKVDK